MTKEKYSNLNCGFNEEEEVLRSVRQSCEKGEQQKSHSSMVKRKYTKRREVCESSSNTVAVLENNVRVLADACHNHGRILPFTTPTIDHLDAESRSNSADKTAAPTSGTNKKVKSTVRPIKSKRKNSTPPKVDESISHTVAVSENGVSVLADSRKFKGRKTSSLDSVHMSPAIDQQNAMSRSNSAGNNAAPTSGPNKKLKSTVRPIKPKRKNATPLEFNESLSNTVAVSENGVRLIADPRNDHGRKTSSLDSDHTSSAIEQQDAVSSSISAGKSAAPTSRTIKELQSAERPIKPKRKNATPPNDGLQVAALSKNNGQKQITTFESSLPGDVYERYEKWQYVERSRDKLCSSETYVSDANDKDAIHLRIGDKIIVESLFSYETKKTLWCHDFIRGYIITGPRALDRIGCDVLDARLVWRSREMDVAVDQNDALKVSREMEDVVRIPHSKNVWVKRNPNHTRGMYHYIRQLGVENLRDRQRTDGPTENRAITTVEFPQMQEVMGLEYQEEDPMYRRLIDLPYPSSIRWYQSKKSIEREPLNDDGRSQCFICQDSISFPPVFKGMNWQEISMSVIPTKTAKDWKQHCEEKHKGQYFHFLVSDQLVNCHQIDVRLLVQKFLRSALTLHDQIQLVDFLILEETKNPLYLTSNLTTIVGSAIGSSKSRIERENLCKLSYVNAKDSYTKKAIDNLLIKAETILREIRQHLQLFDWVGLSMQITSYQLWNATNLFLKRGLYEKKIFPPVSHVSIEDFTMQNAIDMVIHQQRLAEQQA
jgi:hypothetical protein